MELCKSATRRLRGLRLCSEGREDGRVTHLVIGKERRTLKLMLAGAAGAVYQLVLTCWLRPTGLASSLGSSSRNYRQWAWPGSKLMFLVHAVANGAWLVSPEWVTASLEAGKWLPECRFPAKVRSIALASCCVLEAKWRLPCIFLASLQDGMPLAKLVSYLKCARNPAPAAAVITPATSAGAVPAWG